MNKKELQIRLLRLDKERTMVLNYLKHSEHKFAKEIYNNTLEYIDYQTKITLEQLENFQEKTYEH
jgi:hypothetical protein